ncbi:MAG: hypothetical protein ABIX46_08395 [Burkholderiaceae bacterium]
MNRPRLTALLACAAAATNCLAQTAVPPFQATLSTGATEPEVRQGVVEDNGSKIEELRVRGQAQRIVVSPKVGPRTRYEIITGDGSRELSDGAGSTRGATGKRVWNVLNF